MTKEVMSRKAADNEYLHKDFHGAMNLGLRYLEEKYGPEAVSEYLREFTRAYYKPLIDDIRKRGLVALKEHFERIYRIEGAPVSMTLTEDELVLDVPACPAVTHLRERGVAVSPMFVETTRTVNEALCEDTPFAAKLVEYEESTGRSRQRFYRRKR
jgi:hypothetical protein